MDMTVGFCLFLFLHWFILITGYSWGLTFSFHLENPYVRAILFLFTVMQFWLELNHFILHLIEHFTSSVCDACPHQYKFTLLINSTNAHCSWCWQVAGQSARNVFRQNWRPQSLCFIIFSHVTSSSLCSASFLSWLWSCCKCCCQHGPHLTSHNLFVRENADVEKFTSLPAYSMWACVPWALCIINAETWDAAPLSPRRPTLCLCLHPL